MDRTFVCGVVTNTGVSKLSQIKRYSAPDRYVYTENSSKNRSGGMAQMRVAHKVVPIYSTPEAGVRCHVNILISPLVILFVPEWAV